jgi:hypothetical protein
MLRAALPCTQTNCTWPRLTPSASTPLVPRAFLGYYVLQLRAADACGAAYAQSRVLLRPRRACSQARPGHVSHKSMHAILLVARR